MSPEESEARAAADADPEGYRAARDALVAGYRVRVMLEVRHADRGAHVLGSTFTHEPAELGAALVPLVRAMLGRVLTKLDGGPDA
jgi:hypothetical protein